MRCIPAGSETAVWQIVTNGAVKHADAPRRAVLASQLMRGDVTTTKPCAFATRYSARRRSASESQAADWAAAESGHWTLDAHTTHSASADTARCALRRLGVNELRVAPIRRHYRRRRRHLLSPGCRSYPRTGAAQARNGSRRSRDGRKRRSSNAPTTKPSRFSYGTSFHYCLCSIERSRSLFLSFSLLLTLFPVAFVLCPFRDSARRTAVTYVYIDPTDSSVCLHANASIIARGLLSYSPISFVSRKPSAKCIVLPSFVLCLTNNEDGMKDIIT